MITSKSKSGAFASLVVALFFATVSSVFALSPHTPRNNYPSFDRNKDILIAQFDSLPDPDDIHSQAALGSMLIHPDLAGVEVFAVLGAIGEQIGWNGTNAGDYKDPWDLMELIYGPEGDNTWTDAWDGGNEGSNWRRSVDRVVAKVKPILQNGGRVWVQEAGQSDITRDWLWELINNEGVSESVIKNNVIVVQHSKWNHDQTNSSDLSYVKNKATFVSIDDGNKSNSSPNYNRGATSYLDDALSSNNPNKVAQSYWQKAKDVIDREGSSGGHATIGKGGVDCSDCVENWWIFEIGTKADTLQKFFDRYVTNAVGGPVVDAGSNFSVANSTTTATLTAQILDNGGGGSLTYSWTQVGGSNATISSPTSLSTDVTLPDAGTYTFRFTADDGDLTGSDDVTVTRQIDLGNVIYAVNCGGEGYTASNGLIFEADNYFESGDPYTNSISIDGTTDDAIYSSERYAKAPATVDYSLPLPNGNYEIALMWSENTGSGRLMDVTLEGSLAIDALDVLTLAGSKTAYQETVEVTVSDGALDLSIAADANATENFPNIMGIVVSGSGQQGEINWPPSVNAGEDQGLASFQTSTNLDGTVSDDGKPEGGTLTHVWTQESGPATVSFGSPTAEDTTVTLPAEGTYVFRLTADDTDIVVYDEITVVRGVPNEAPDVEAGNQQVLSSGTTSANLNATVTDDGLSGQPLTYAWTQQSGPNASISDPSSEDTAVVLSGNGTYVFRLTVDDGALSSFDDVTIIVESTAGVFKEENGIVIMEAESTKSTLGDWNLRTSGVSGHTGNGYLEFTGNNFQSGGAKSPLVYKFKIQNAGVYRMVPRAATTRPDSTPDDQGNDMYVKMEGDFTPGGNATLSNLTKNQKFFTILKNNNKWVWGRQFDMNNSHTFREADYNFKAGETYTLTISGRSKSYSVDRIVLYRKSDYSASQAQNTNLAQSPVTGGGGNDNEAPVVTVNPSSITVPNSETSVDLNATVTDDGKPNNSLTYTWTTQSGPNGASPNFGSASSEDTSVTLPVEGTYVFNLSVSDGDLSSSGTVTVTRESSGTVEPTVIVLRARDDFGTINSGEVPYYRDSGNDALAIDASKENRRGPYARAETTFGGDSGTWDVTITTITEEDGESNYRLLVNGQEVASYVNPYVGPGSSLDLEPNDHVWEDIALNNGDTIAIESNAVTNGEIPEGNGTAWARGRWRQLSLETDGNSNGNNNLRPVVTLPSNFAVGTDVTSATLTSTVTDDGKPEGGTLTYQWTQVSGPSSTISTPTSSTTDVTLPDAGSYTFRLTADDTELTGFGEITVTRPVDQGNIVYAVNCGGGTYTTGGGIIYEADNYFTSGDAFEKSRSIAGTEDDELFHSERYAKAPATVDYAFPVANGDYQIKLMWSENTGSGRLMDVSLEGQLAIDALDVITLAGSDKTAYEQILDVSVTDGSLDLSIASDSNATEKFPNVMAIQVLAVETGGNDNVAPVVNSGADVELSSKSTSTYLDATVSDDGLPGDPLTYTWTQVSGPETVAFGMPSSEDTTVKLSAPGTYILRLTVDDGELQTSDDITLIRQDESAAQPIIDVDIPEVTEVVVAEKQAGKEMTVSVQAVASGTYHMEHAVDLDSDWNLVPGMVETGVLAGESVTMVADVPEEQTGFFRIVFTPAK